MGWKFDKTAIVYQIVDDVIFQKIKLCFSNEYDHLHVR